MCIGKTSGRWAFESKAFLFTLDFAAPVAEWLPFPLPELRAGFDLWKEQDSWFLHGLENLESGKPFSSQGKVSEF